MGQRGGGRIFLSSLQREKCKMCMCSTCVPSALTCTTALFTLNRPVSSSDLLPSLSLPTEDRSTGRTDTVAAL